MMTLKGCTMSNRLVENEHPSLKGEKSIISSSPASLSVFDVRCR